MRKLFVLLVLATAVVLWVPGVRERIWSTVSGTVAEWTKPDAGPVKGMEVIKVYVPRGDSYYHRKDCPLIAGKTAVPTNLELARELYHPCPVCKPPQ
jgi:hypothetical protein